MRKINPNDYVEFRLQRPGFTYTGKSFHQMFHAFQDWAAPCTFIGIRDNGVEAILDEK